MPESPPDTVINDPTAGRVAIPYALHFAIATELRDQRVRDASRGTEPEACMEDAAAIVLAAARAGFALVPTNISAPLALAAALDAPCTVCGKPATTASCGRGGCPLGADL